MKHDSTARRGHVRLRDKKLYRATVVLDAPWVHLSECSLLSGHLDGYTRKRLDDFTIPADAVKRITWEAP